MSMQYSHSNQSSQHHNEQQFQLVLKSILPQIQKQLLKDIQIELQNQFQQKYLKAIQQIDNQALKQYEFAIKQLDQNSKLLQQQRNDQISKQFVNLKHIYETMQQEKLIKLQEKFLQQNFDEKIMSHQRIQELQKQIQEEIYEMLQQKHEATKQRQLKQLIIGHQAKQTKIRKQLDNQIKSRIYSSSGLEQLKQQITQSRIQMGSQRSQYNLKLKKIQTQIKDYQEKIIAINRMGNIQKLRQKHNELKLQLVEQEEIEKDLEKQCEINSRIKELEREHMQMEKETKRNGIIEDNRMNDDSLEESQQNYMKTETDQEDQIINSKYNKKNKRNANTNQQKTLKRQPKNNSFALSSRQHQNNVLIQQNHEQYSQQQSYQHQNHQNINLIGSGQTQNSKKFDLTAYFKDYLLSSQTAKITQSQNIILSQGQTTRTQPKASSSVLNLQNISQLLKQKVQMDPLQRYLMKQSVQKQNDMNNQNIRIPNGQKSSNFSELYQQHLKNLNKGLGKKPNNPSTKGNHSTSKSTGFSQMAKKAIIKNLSQYHKQTFYNSNQSNNSKQTSEMINIDTSVKFNNCLNSQNRTLGSYRTQQSNLLASFK